MRCIIIINTLLLNDNDCFNTDSNKCIEFNFINNFNSDKDFNQFIKNKNNNKLWIYRNKLANIILSYMKKNNIPSIEKSGKYTNLPTIFETKLIFWPISL